MILFLVAAAPVGEEFLVSSKSIYDVGAAQLPLDRQDLPSLVTNQGLGGVGVSGKTLPL